MLNGVGQRYATRGAFIEVTALLDIIQEPEVKEAWQMVASTVLWTIWLFRNSLIFNNVKTGKDGVLRVLQARIFKWLEVNKIVCGNIGNLFCVNPRGVVKLCFNQQLNEF